MSLPKSKMLMLSYMLEGFKNPEHKNPLKYRQMNRFRPSPNVISIFKEKLDLKKYPDGNSENLKRAISRILISINIK